MSNLEGVIYHEKDREDGPFVLRQGGTNNFVTDITTDYYSRWGSPGEAVAFEGGWNNPRLPFLPHHGKGHRGRNRGVQDRGLLYFHRN
jgi:hypothetical protein